MRGALCLTILLILLPLGQGILSSSTVSASSDSVSSVKLCEVLAPFPYEHVGVANLGTGIVDLTGWTISDGEGTCVLGGGAILRPGGELFIGSNLTFLRLIHPNGSHLDIGKLEKKGRLTLADEGDEVRLLGPSGDVVDVVAYGKSGYDGEGWVGEKAPSAPEGKALRRTSMSPFSDTNTKGDWSIVALGRSSFLPTSIRANVEPFLCPDHMRARLLREISFAHDSVNIEVYILSDLTIASCLASASGRGVCVRILVEGEPVGGLTSSQEGILKALELAGCEVYRSCDFHGFKRFDYLHPKFMVVDARRAIVASENFATSSLDENRGWGVAIESPVIAAALLDVFENDVDPRFPDIRPLAMTSSSIPHLEVFHRSDEPAPDPIEAEVGTVLAPDFGYASIIELLEGARGRLYLELYYLSDNWQSGMDIYRAILDAARRGARTRLILDGSWYNNEEGAGNKAIVEDLNAIASSEGLDLKAKLLSPYHGPTTLHNKGVIADDEVLVGSINWVRASFERNREVGVIIDSPPVAEFYAAAFEQDWVDDMVPPELAVPSLVELDEGEQLVLNANASDNSGTVRVLWDVGCDGSIQAEGPFLVADLPPGETLINVMALDPSNNSCDRTVRVVVVPRSSGSYLPYGVAASLVIPFAIWRMRKRVKRR